jgi:predicted nucleic-acid-binding protein
MVIADANTMIRCIIGDDTQKIQELQEIRSTQIIVYTLEVVAEVVYVLVKVYGIPREEASHAIQRFLNSANILCANNRITVTALQLFAENHLDCLKQQHG